MSTTLLRPAESAVHTSIHPPSQHELTESLTPAERIQLRLGEWLITRVAARPAARRTRTAAHHRAQQHALEHREREANRLLLLGIWR